MAGGDISETAERAWIAIQRGDVHTAKSLERSLPPSEAAWRVALAAARWRADPSDAAPPAIDDMRALLASGASPRALAIACVEGARISLVALDPVALDAWLELHAELADEGTEAWLAVGRGWRALLEGRPVALEALAAGVKAGRDPSLVVERNVLEAWAALEAGDLATATKVARRAVRMARAEEMPQLQYLAGLVLARCRRHAGHAHLATRILSALVSIAPASWHGWIRWELAMAGSPTDPAREAATPAERASDALEAVLRALLAGRSIDEVRKGLHATLDAATRCAPMRADAEVLQVAVDPGVALPNTERADPERAAAAAAAAERADGERAAGERAAGERAGSEVSGLAALAAWRRGSSAMPPPILTGLFGLSGGDAITRHAYVVVSPGRPGRRVLGLASHAFGDHVRFDAPKGNQGRAVTALAALALAGPRGLAVDALFRTIYGFAFEPEIHRGTFDVVLHRVRGLLGEVGDIVRGDEKVRLEPAAAFLVADARCASPLEDIMLVLMARREGASARDAATTLGVPVRTVYRALERLLESGACEKAPQGKGVYRVEDTTFQPPTR